jgi:hypothetical protein
MSDEPTILNIFYIESIYMKIVMGSSISEDGYIDRDTQ